MAAAAGSTNDHGRPRSKEAVELAAVSLAGGSTVVEAAAAAGVDHSTLKQWRKKPAFKRRVAALHRQAVARAVGKLSSTMVEAAEKLRSLLSSGDERISLRAAGEILSHGVKLTELADLQRQVEELKRRFEETKPSGKRGPS